MQSVYFVQISKRRQPSGLNNKNIPFFSKTAKNRKITATEEAEKEKICTWGQVKKARLPHLPAVSKIEP